MPQPGTPHPEIAAIDQLASASVSRLILLATAAPQRRNTAALTSALSGVDTDSVAAWARAHGVWRQTEDGLRQTTAFAATPWPSPLWREQARRQALRGLRSVGELARLSEAFERADIPMMALKGPALAADILGDPMARDAGDLDVMVREEDLPRADALARTLGWQRDGPQDLSRSDAFHRLLVRASCDLAYHHRDHGLRLEMHWRWHRNPYALPFDAKALWSVHREVSVGGRPVRVPDRSLLWLYLASHGGRHGWARLKWLNDIRHACAAPAFRDALPEALTRGRATGVARPLEVALHLVRRLDDLAGLEPSADQPALVDPRAAALAARAAGALYPDGRLTRPRLNKWMEMAAEWRLTPSLRRRFQGLVHRLVLPAEYDALTLPLPAEWEVLYPMLRPGLWLWRRRPW